MRAISSQLSSSSWRFSVRRIWRRKPQRDARAIVTVVDVTGAILPGATVSRDAARAVRRGRRHGHANEAGVATIPGSSPAGTRSKPSSRASTPSSSSDVRLRAGDNKQQIELGLTAFTDTVEVGLDPQAAAADPNNTLATAADRRRDRRAVGRSERVDAPAGRDGGRHRARARRRFQRRLAAVARRDPIDSHRPRHVPGREPFRGERRHRHHHAGRRRPDSRRLFDARARQRAGRRQSVRRHQGARAHAELRRQHRRRDRPEQELVLAVHGRPQAVRHAGRDLHHARPASSRRCSAGVRTTAGTSTACSTTR